jgi:hypothetical protein
MGDLAALGQKPEAGFCGIFVYWQSTLRKFPQYGYKPKQPVIKGQGIMLQGKE